MAIRELFSVLAINVDVAKDTSFQAGMALARDTTTGLAVKADRATHVSKDFIGFAADDKGRTGNTMVQVDPVGSTIVSGSDFIANNNGFYAASKRALGDYQDESVTNVTDLTSGSTGYQGPRRGIGVFASSGAQFVTDMITITLSTSATTADAGGSHTPAYNDLYTFGVTANAGKLVYLASSAHGPAIARIDKWDSDGSLAYFTQLLP